MRTTADRIRHTIGFEVIGLIIFVPFASWLFSFEMVDIGGLAIFFSLLAAGWNYVYNIGFDRALLAIRGSIKKTHLDRVLHAVLFEGGLLIVTLPIIAWWLNVSLWQAFMMDLSMVLFYLVYAWLYNIGYDHFFPVPEVVTS